MAEKSTLLTRPLEPGETVGGRYEIVKLIGHGGMASVYLVRDHEREGEECALKVLHKEFAEDRTYVERFLREVKLIKEIDSPYLVKPFDIGTADGYIYFTMEFVPGDNLEHLMSSRGFSNIEISEVIVKICRGLSAIHERGIVHRDLKPANVLMSPDGTLKILDFGVARLKASRLTQPNQRLGSLCYIAPEVWLGEEITSAVDLYSLGIMLYELLTDGVPFEDPLPEKMLELHLSGKIIPPKEKNPRVPDWLNTLIVRLLSKSAKDRPASAAEIIAWVETLSPFGKANLNTQDRLQAVTVVTPSHPPDAKRTAQKTYIFKLSATRLIEDSKSEPTRPRRKATVSITLPKHSALVLEIEAPSRDVIALGFLLASLQVFDGFFTSYGVHIWGIQAEGNAVLRSLMHKLGADSALILVKSLTILLVVFLTILAKRQRVFKNVVGLLSCIYLFLAIIPWTFFISRHFSLF